MNKITKIYFYLFLCLLHFPLKAQYNSLLWEITGNNLSKPSYLFGTMHVKDKRAFQFHDSLFIKLRSCEVFAGELIIDKQAAKEMAPDLLLPQGTELKTLLTEKEYKKVKKYCSKNLGVLSLLVNRIKPIFTSALITESLLKSDMPAALDEYLQEKAKENKLDIIGLETMQEQMDALGEMSYEDQAKMLYEQIDNIDDEQKELQRMADVYASQNLDSIYAFVQVPEMDGAVGDALIKDRNLVMANRLEKVILQNSTFCAVGAAHLPKEDGIIELLRKKGYTLRPIVKK